MTAFTSIAARERLASMTSGNPALTPTELDALVRVAAVRPPVFVAGGVYVAGDLVAPSFGLWNSWLYEARGGGVAGVEPAWPVDAGAEVTSGAVTFRRVKRDPASRAGSARYAPGVGDYNLPRGAVEGWTWKAAKAAESVNISVSGASIARNSLFDHCERMRMFYQTAQGPRVMRISRSDVIR